MNVRVDGYLFDYLTCTNLISAEQARARGAWLGKRCHTVTVLTELPVRCAGCGARVA